MKVGILFGGPSRERNRSLPNARAAFALLDRALFEPIPLLVDARGRLYLMHPAALEAADIQDLLSANPDKANGFVRAQESLPDTQEGSHLRHLDRPLEWPDLASCIDFAWIAMQGTFAEDGQLQEKLEELGVPYSGFAPAVCRYTADPGRLRDLLDLHDFSTTPAITLTREDWTNSPPQALHQRVREQLRFPVRVSPGDIPTACGQTELEHPDDLERFELAVNRAFFEDILPIAEWQDRSTFEQQETIQLLGDLEDGLGFPIEVQTEAGTILILAPDQLLEYFNEAAALQAVTAFRLRSKLEGLQEKVLIKQVPEEVPFSCTVVATPDAGLLALPPQIPHAYTNVRFLDHISNLSIEIFQRLQLRAFAQISGYSLSNGQFVIDRITSQPDATMGAPIWGSFGQIGLTPSQALTLLIQASLKSTPAAGHQLGQQLQQQLSMSRAREEKGIALICGGFGYGGGLSLESAREVFQWLDGMQGYRPLPIWETTSETGTRYFRLPAEVFLSASMPELHHLCSSTSVPQQYDEALETLSQQYGSRAYPKIPEPCPVSSWPALAQYVWLTLQQPPSATQSLHTQLQRLGLPHNSATDQVVRLCADKYQLLQTLGRNGVAVPYQLKLTKPDYNENAAGALSRLENQVGYPMVVRPLYGHYSSGVQLLNSRSELQAYTRLLFRPGSEEGREAKRILGLPPGAIFPQNTALVAAPQITRKAGYRLLEISAHVYPVAKQNGAVQYQWLPISEVRPNGHILRPGEKYEQAIKYSSTPARFASDEGVAWSIQQQLEKAVRLLDLKSPANLDAFVHLQEGKAPEVYIFDINLQPPVTKHSLLGVQIAAAGHTPAVLLEAVITGALQSSETDNQNIPAEAEASAQPTYNTTTMNEDTPSATPEPSNSKRSDAGQPNPLAEQVMARAKIYLKEAWQFLKSPVFLRNFAGILLMVFGSVYIVRWSLKIYTRHGESIQVPDYTGMDMRDAVRKAEKQNFTIVAIDSFFDSNKRPNTIYQQEPMPNQRAKEGRTIYVSKYRAQADSVLLPTLMRAGYNFDQYRTKLRRIDVSTRIQERIFDNKQEENTVLYFFHNGRKITDDMLRRGVKVPRGSTLEFVITERITNEVALPDLICKRFDEAKFLLTSSNLSLGQTFGAEGAEGSAFIYQQEPEFVPGRMVIKGASIDLYLTTTRPDGCPESVGVPGESEEDF
ncbi:MAG: PASTA domain-containing protein [Phaeodactylibacter sp.]|uniref:PASTA domain-containing protein n=1 Tax=Phaeodactylibacter sp. TaxID=1940289 RepID=UPI0032EDD7D5